MIKYKSNSYYLLDHMLLLLIALGFFIFLTYIQQNNNNILIVTSLISTILIFLFLRLLSRVFKLEFHDKHIRIKYFFTGLEKRIAYSEIKEYHHIHGYKTSSLNIIKYLDNRTLKIKKIRLTNVVTNDVFLEFSEWMTDKNNTIELKFYPSNSELAIAYKNKQNSSS